MRSGESVHVLVTGPVVGVFSAGPEVGVFSAGPEVGVFPAGPEVGVFPTLAGPPVGAALGDELGSEVGVFPTLAGPPVGAALGDELGSEVGLRLFGLEVGSSELPRTMFILQKMDRNNTRPSLSFIVMSTEGG